MWPHVFSITDIAKLIVSFLPWYQYLQWIEECDVNDLQTTLCNWYPQSYANGDVKRAFVLRNNLRALNVSLSNFDTNDWYMLFECAEPDLLQNVLQTTVQKPQVTFAMLCNTPIANFKVVTNFLEIDATLQRDLIYAALSHPDTQQLIWILNAKQWHFVIDRELCWTDELWAIVEPSVAVHRVTCHLDVPSAIPRQMIMLFLPTMSHTMRYDLFQKKLARDIEMAAILWRPEFEFGDIVHIHIYETWKDVLPTSRCERAIAYLASPNSNHFVDFKAAVHANIHTFLSHMAFHTRKQIFKRACQCGAYHIAKFIWDNSISQKPLLRLLEYAGECAKIEMLEFAFEQLRGSQEFESIMILWNYDAYEYKNGVLLKFLLSKQVFCDGILESMPANCHADTFANRLGDKPVEFVSLLWPTHKHMLTKTPKLLFAYALQCKNIPVVQFLANQDCFELNQKLLSKHIVLLATYGVIDALRKINDFKRRITMAALCEAYACALNVATLRTLWNLQPHPDSELFTMCFRRSFVFDSDARIDNCIFFLAKKLITHKDLYDALTDSESLPLVRKLFGRLYFDFDL